MTTPLPAAQGKSTWVSFYAKWGGGICKSTESLGEVKQTGDAGRDAHPTKVKQWPFHQATQTRTLPNVLQRTGTHKRMILWPTRIQRLVVSSVCYEIWDTTERCQILTWTLLSVSADVYSQEGLLEWPEWIQSMFFKLTKSPTKLCPPKMENLTPFRNDWPSFTHNHDEHNRNKSIFFHGLRLATQDLTSIKST